MMKNSNVEWIGQIPDDWEVKRLKMVLQERNESNNPEKTNFILSLTNDRGVIPYDEKGDVGNKSKDDVTGYKLAYPNDIVLNSMNVVIGSVGISKYFGAVSPVYYMLFPRYENDDIRYYNYIFQTREFQNKLKGYGNGIMEIRMRIQMSKLNSVEIPVPNHIQQKKIADLLDKKCEQIDRLIEIQQQEIEKLKEYKTSVITQAVTKGLDPNVPMKESGVSEIGLLPVHWRIIRIKNVAKIENGKEIISEGGDIPVYGSGGIFKYTDRPLFEGISMLYGRKGTIDNPLLVSGKFWTVDTMFYTSHIKNIVPKYLYYCSKGIIDYNFYKSGSVLPSMTQTQISNIKITLPIEGEQDEIVRYLDKKCFLIDELKNNKQQKIEKLQEYKKSLIYEYVTGKRRVI